MLTQKRLKELLDYDPDTGIFTWKVSIGGRTKGTKAGGLHASGMYIIRIDRKIYSAGRLAYLFMTGEWPCGTAMRWNGIKDDNRWENLYDSGNTQFPIDQKTIKKFFHYDPDSGRFIWLVSRGGKNKIGAIASTINKEGYQYIKVRINGKPLSFLAHRLAFLYMEGKWPPGDLPVHHKNGIRDDNRWENLEIVTTKENVSARGNGTIQCNDGTWGLVLTKKGFSSKEEAVEHYRKLEKYSSSI